MDINKKKSTDTADFIRKARLERRTWQTRHFPKHLVYSTSESAFAFRTVWLRYSLEDLKSDETERSLSLVRDGGIVTLGDRCWWWRRACSLMRCASSAEISSVTHQPPICSEMLRLLRSNKTPTELDADVRSVRVVRRCVLTDYSSVLSKGGAFDIRLPDQTGPLIKSWILIRLICPNLWTMLYWTPCDCCPVW